MKTRRGTPVPLAVLVTLLAAGLTFPACEAPPADPPPVEEPPAAVHTTILEPIQPLFDPTAPTHAVGGDSEQVLAQTFTIGRDGTLAGVVLPLGCASGELGVEIRDVEGDEPGAAVLALGTFPADSFVSDVTVFKLFGLPATAVSAGDRRALVLRNPTGSCGTASAPPGDHYPGGEGFFDARPNPPGWAPLHVGHGIHDLAFQIVLQVE